MIIFLIFAAPTGSPGVPTASAIMSTNITLIWTQIDCLDRNGVITSYIIQYGEGTNRDITITTPSSATTHLITDLKPFTQYTFTVAGVSSVGTGSFSSASLVTRTAEDSKQFTITYYININVIYEYNTNTYSYIHNTHICTYKFTYIHTYIHT